MADDEINSFIGSILNIKTKPSPEGIGSCIIGTLIAVDQKIGSITLDDVVKNGEMLPNGFILSTADIGDLQICGRSSVPSASTVESRNPTRPSKEGTAGSKPLKENVPVKRHTSEVQKTQSTKPSQPQSQVKPRNSLADSKSQQQQEAALSTSAGLNTALASVLSPSKANADSSPSSVSANGHALMNMFSQCMKIQSQPKSEEVKSAGSLGLEPTASAKCDGPKVVYKASAIEQKYFVNARKPDTRAFQQILQQQNQSENPNPFLSGAKKSAPRKDQQGTTLPHSSAGSSNGNGNTQRKTTLQESQNGTKGSAHKPGPSTGSSVKHNLHNNTTTFEMTNDEIQANEFDFQKNNNMFEKLPVHSKRPTKVQKVPKFTTEDTTLKVARTIESVKLRGITSEKTFITSTGIIIPAVDQGTRNSILTLAHNLGITQSRTVESMGRSIAQICIPLLGDSFRFSPEREDDRPKVLFCAGPHWQGAATICAARVLASQGVQTFVYSIMGETTPGSVDIEQKLYRLSCQPFTQDLESFREEKFDMVVLGVGGQLKVEAKLKEFRPFLEDRTVVLVDPPLLPSYQKTLFSSDGDSGSSRVYLITANLPLPYATDSGLKVFLVNLGIPRRIYEENNVIYKSPFGDKLVIPIFSAPSSLQP